MSVHRLPDRRSGVGGRRLPVASEETPKWAKSRVYAICFDLDTAEAERLHPTNSHTGSWKLIESVFQARGFHRRQGSVYFGGPSTTPVDCVLAVQELARRHPWIRFAVKDIRMLRIEENNDLMPALERQAHLPLDSVSGM